MSDLEVTFSSVSLPTNTSGTVHVYEDVGDDGGSNSVTVDGVTVDYDNHGFASLADGQTFYTISGFDASSGNRIYTRVEVDNTDDVSTANVSEVVDVATPFDTFSRSTTSHVSSITSTSTATKRTAFTRSATSHVGSTTSTSAATLIFHPTRSVTSHVDAASSWASSDRTSLELLDYPVEYDESRQVWVTPWFFEDAILGDEDLFALVPYTTGGEGVTARITAEYDSDGTGSIDATSDSVDVTDDGAIHYVENIPVDTDGEGRYRLVISHYSGYNTLTDLSFALVH